jgi:SAM-dependent methyltransferase
VKAFWHPVSAVYLDRPRVLASPAVLALMMAGEGRADVVYAGDRMWPAIRHGQPLVVSPVAPAPPAAGEVVLSVERGVPDIVRVERGAGRLDVIADADFGPPRPVAPEQLLGRITQRLPRRAPHGPLARTVLDLLEAAGHGPDQVEDPAATVREKYDDQAVHYDRLDAAALDPDLARRIEASVPRGLRILVAGSGAGREAFALEAMGYQVCGVDFAARMIDAARAEAVRRGSSATFVAADLRSHTLEAGSLAAVVFTYDVYSFLPGSKARVAILARIASWLAPGGALFLSARRTHGIWDRAVLGLQGLARVARRGHAAWGDSHTRWLDASGNMRRSYVHVFTDAALARETRAAGFRRLSWEGGHGLYVRRGGAA